jgi:hypothetical protein
MDRKKNRRAEQKRRGRPSLPKGEGKRFALGLRVTEERRRALDEAAAQSGRSISQEIELRLEESFRDESKFGGREMLGLFQMMAGAATMVEERLGGRSWSTDWEAFQAVREAWRQIIDKVGPDVPVEWQERFAALEAAKPGPPPPPLPPRPIFKGLGLLGGGSVSETDKAEFDRARREWEVANDTWNARFEAFSKELEVSLGYLKRLSGLGSEVASGFLPSKQRRLLAEALMREPTNKE